MREHPLCTKKFNILYLGIVLVLVCTALFFITPVYAIDNRTGNTVDRSSNDSDSFTTGTSPYNIGINLTKRRSGWTGGYTQNSFGTYRAWTCAFYSDTAYIIYKNYSSITFCQIGTYNTNNSA
mgnify:CR=1 FL=1